MLEAKVGVLILSLRPGQDFFVGDEQIVVNRILGEAHYQVTLNSTGRRVDVTDRECVEILPDVFLQSAGRAQLGVARIAIDAPREITIIRGDRYREGRPNGLQDVCCD